MNTWTEIAVLTVRQIHPGTSRLEIVEEENIQQIDIRTSAVQLVSSTDFSTFNITYESGDVGVLRNGNPLFTMSFPSAIPIRYVGVGAACCSYRSFRLAKYDPAWRTDVWVEQGFGGYSNLADLE